jgi:type II secretory pathway predicted ATPase ExeA
LQVKSAKRLHVRFTATEIHQIWQGDAKAEFTVTFTNGITKKYRILSLQDDCSRFIVAAIIVTSESTQAAVKAFFNAASRYGLPQSFYADRGSPYDSDIFRQGLVHHEPYLLLIGESGSGKTALMRHFCDNLDKNLYTPVYLCARPAVQINLTAILAKYLHVPLSSWCSRTEAFYLVTLALNNNPTAILLFVDEAQFLQDATLQELRLLVEADLMAKPSLSVVLCGLPSLYEKLSLPSLFPVARRFLTKIRLHGLHLEEISPFIKHCSGIDLTTLFSPEAISIIFEHAHGLPASVIALVNHCINSCGSSTPVNKQQVQKLLASLDLF